MGLACLMCGDYGFNNAFVHCVGCLDFVVHRYCLDVMPETVDEHVDWFCDDCDLKVQHKKRRNAPCQTTHVDSVKLPNKCFFQENTHFKASKNVNGLTVVGHVVSAELLNKCSSQENTHFKALENDEGHTVVDHVDSVELPNKCSSQENTHFKALENGKGLTAVDHVDSVDLPNKWSSQEYETENTMDNQSEHPNLLGEKQNAKEKKRPNTEAIMEEEQKKPVNNSFKKLRKECTSTDTMKRDKTASDSVLPKEKEEKEVFEQRDEKRLSEEPCESNTEPGTSNDHIKEEGVTASSGYDNQGFEVSGGARIISATNNQNVFAKDPSIPPNLDPNAPTEPQIRPVWRGSFEILYPNKHILEGLMGHLSSKACAKAYKVADQFQTVLQLEMLPKVDVWPKRFRASQPSDTNIALYFFPSKASERVFDQLVNEMMEKELAMRAHVQDVELLLFPSTELPILHWRIQAKYYLWGVFKGSQRARSRTHPSTKEPECKNAENANGSRRVKSPVAKRGRDRSPLGTLSNDGSVLLK